MCGSARVLCISDPQDEISASCLTLVREVEIKPDENQAGGKLKIRSKSKPGQGMFMLDSSKVKRYQLQVPGSQH